MGIYVDKRTFKNGTVQFRFTYIDRDGKRKRIPAGQHPHFKTLDEAQAWASSQEGHDQAMKAKVQQRLEWKKQYYDFDNLLTKYLAWMKKRAPNSWEKNEYYLSQVVFPFFLTIKKANNVNFWHMHFQDFKVYLEDEAKTTKGKKGQYAYGTSNGVIRTLNTFIRYLKEHNLIDPENAVTCPNFPKHKLNKKTFEDVITPEEYDTVLPKLKEISESAADLFTVLYHTGMRFSEGWGLPMSMIYGGEVKGPIGDELKKFDLRCYGYIVLESQPADDLRKRLPDGTVPRKPLKTRREISPKNSRTIAVTDRVCWNVIVARYKKQKELYDRRVYGDDKVNYLLFDDLNKSQAVNSLRVTYEKLKIRVKTYHCCRHSKVTYLTGETRSFFLVKAMLGHKSDAFEDYLHLYEMIALKAKQQSQDIDFVDDL